MPKNELQLVDEFMLPNKKLDYCKLKHFIDGVFFPHISNATPSYGKFRFSNNTNGKDASVFHGDLYNHTDENVIEIFTCLLYIDPAEMEIIPQTHKKDYVAAHTATELFDKRINVKIDAGDILIFHSNLHHRGVKYNIADANSKDGVKSRRLLQVFDVTFDERDHKKYMPKIITLMTGYSLLVQMQSYLSGGSSGPGNFLSFMNYFLVRHDLQYRSILIDISECEKKGKLLSYEPGTRGVYRDFREKYGMVHDENINVVVDDILEKNSREVSNFKLYMLLALIVLFFVVRNYLKNQRK